MSERLQKVLAAEGLGSRREIERWIVAGRLTINGEVASLGAKANLNDIIELDGKRLRLSSKTEQTRVIIYNKPEGEVSTRVDPEGRKTVFDRLPAKKGERLPVISYPLFEYGSNRRVRCVRRQCRDCSRNRVMEKRCTREVFLRLDESVVQFG